MKPAATAGKGKAARRPIARRFIEMLMVFTPKALRNIAWGCLPLATPGGYNGASPPRVAAEKTRQPWAMSHNAFGIALVSRIGAYQAP